MDAAEQIAEKAKEVPQSKSLVPLLEQAFDAKDRYTPILVQDVQNSERLYSDLSKYILAMITAALVIRLTMHVMVLIALILSTELSRLVSFI